MRDSMKRVQMFLAALLLCALAVTVAKGSDVAEETAALKESVDSQLEELLSTPAGVFDMEYGDEGQIIRLKVKGEADVPTSMHSSRGDRYARGKANRDARAAFTKFLGENVVFSESETEDFMIHEKDGQESSEVMNNSTALYSSNSAAMLKGLIVLLEHLEGEGDGRTCVVVLGWSKKLADAADIARADMAREKPKSKDKSSSASVTGAAKNVSGNSKTITRMGKMDDF